MNKSELIHALSEKAEIAKSAGEKALNAIVETITKALKKGESVQLVGFGTFHTKHRKARQGRNPRTGQAIKIAAAKVPGFKAGKGLKDAVNKR